MSKYLLPCSKCGADLTIDVGQAGQLVVCDCGTETEVPTMRGIQKLKRADVPPAAEPFERNWSRQQGMLFSAGLALMVIGAGLCAYLLWERSKLDTARPPDRLRVRDEEAIEDLTPEQLWAVWEQMRDFELSQGETPKYELNRQQAQQLFVVAMVSGGVSLAGLCVLGSAFFVRPAAAKKKKRGRPRQAAV